MDPTKGEHSDSDISDDWNVVEAKESFALSESESIEVIGDDIDSAVEVDDATTAATAEDNAGLHKSSGNILDGKEDSDVENVARRPQVSDDDINDANESDSSSMLSLPPFARSLSQSRPTIIEQGLQLQRRSSTLLVQSQTSTMFFISNQMFAFLMLLVAVALSISGEGALSRLANFDPYSLTRDDFRAEDYQSHSEMRDCSKRLVQFEKKIENIRLAALSLEDGSMSLPVFMDFIKDIGRPAFGQAKTKPDEFVDLGIKKRRLQRNERFQDQTSGRFEEQRINNFQRFGDGSAKNSQKFEGQCTENCQKFRNQRKEGPKKFEDQINKVSPRFEDQIIKDSPRVENQINKDSPKFEDKIIKDSSSFGKQNVHVPNKSENVILQISLILKKSDKPDFQKLGVALLNVSSHLSESSEKIKNTRLLRESSHNKSLDSLLEKLSLVSNKIHQQLFDFFQRIVLKFSKNLNKIDEQFRKIYCPGNSGSDGCQGRTWRREGKSVIRENKPDVVHKFDKFKKSEYLTEKYEMDGDTAGKVENYEGSVWDKDSNSKDWQKKNNNFGKNREKELADEKIGGRNFGKDQKMFKNKDNRKMGSVPVGFEGSNKKKEDSRSEKNLKNFETINNHRGKESNSSDSSKNSVNDELRLKKNFVQMSFENVDTVNNVRESSSNFYNAESVISNENRNKKQIDSDEFDFRGDDSRLQKHNLLGASEMFLKHEISANLQNDGVGKTSSVENVGDSLHVEPNRRHSESASVESRVNFNIFDEPNTQHTRSVVESGDDLNISDDDVDETDDLIIDDETTTDDLINDDQITDDFFYAVSSEDGLNKGKTYKEFDKFSKKDIAKLKKQILKTTRQNVEQLFESFLDSLMAGKALNSTSQSEAALSDWFLLLGDRRSEMRRINSQSDWLFDRAVNRRDRHRQTEETSLWLFRRALERQRCRETPNCRSSSRSFRVNTRQPFFPSRKASPDR